VGSSHLDLEVIITAPDGNKLLEGFPVED
jgi:hypothetical protein